MNIMKQFGKDNRKIPCDKQVTMRENKNSNSKKLDTITKKVDVINKKLNVIYDEAKKQDRLKDDPCRFYRFNIKSTIPYITGLQIYTMYNRGWTKQDICDISGLTYEQADKLYRQYAENINK